MRLIKMFTSTTKCNEWVIKENINIIQISNSPSDLVVLYEKPNIDFEDEKNKIINKLEKEIEKLKEQNKNLKKLNSKGGLSYVD